MAVSRPAVPRGCMARSHQLGLWGEQAAARYLAARGWAVLHRNWRLGHKEIDLVVRRRGVVAFVEVKSRSGAAFGHPLEAITASKRREIETVARAWIARHGRPGESYRFDAIAVVREGGTPATLLHVEDAWRLPG
jgi:putative endonuclease